MNQAASSPWDFGELFGPTAARRVFSVHELTQQIRQLLERNIGKVWVTGEVSNFRLQSSGHAYFTLKDAGAQVQCVVFRGDAVGGREWLKDGQKLILQGELTVYEPRGQYQLRVLAAEPHGVGALQLAYERLRRQLQAEGLFEAARKRKLPGYPQRIGIVTSLSGAALRDVVHVVRRRQPGLELVLAACRVQGTGAAAEIAGAIQWLNEWSVSHPDGAADLILVTRGGGSLEDLWAFNEEIVARAVFHSRLPVISAVGHEIDFTICDFVADVRAATPSAAAEMITEGVFGKRQYLVETALYLRQLCAGRFSRRREQLREVAHRLGREHPRRIWQRHFQHLDELEDGMGRCARHHWRRHQARGGNLQQRLARLRPAAILRRRRDRVDELAFRLHQAHLVKFDRLRRRAEHACLKLRLLSPEQILRRGYSITTDAASGSVIRSADEVRAGQNLRTRLHHGAVHSTVIPGGDQA